MAVSSIAYRSLCSLKGPAVLLTLLRHALFQAARRYSTKAHLPTTVNSIPASRLVRGTSAVGTSVPHDAHQLEDRLKLWHTQIDDVSKTPCRPFTRSVGHLGIALALGCRILDSRTIVEYCDTFNSPAYQASSIRSNCPVDKVNLALTSLLETTQQPVLSV